MLGASPKFENREGTESHTSRERRETVFFHSESVAIDPVSSSRTFLGRQSKLIQKRMQ